MSNLKNKIYAQSILTSLFVILTMGVLFIIFFYTYYISTAKLELRTKLNFACTLYSNHMPDVPYNEKLCYILEKEQNSVFYFQLLNHTGELVLDSNGINFYNNVLLTKDFTFAYKDDTYRDVVDALRGSYMPNEYMDNNNRRLLSMTAPIIRDGNTWGYLRYTTCLDKLFKNLYVIILIVVFTLIIIFVFTLLINSYLAKTIMKPLNKLTEISKNMSNGDFTERIDIDGNDELSKLGSNLNHMADKILEGNKLKNEFISSISHELRTPLTAIKGWTELFLTDTALSEEDKKEGLEIISAETNRLNSLVEDLLDYSRLEGRRIQLNLTKLKLYPILHEIKHYFKSQLDKSKLELIVNCEQDIVILGDSNRLKQVFINIIHNSIKFSSPYHKIFIYVITFNNYVVIKIKDQGVGISPTDIKKVKEKFYKGASSKSGSGIGLAICDEIVKLHNGTLTISSIEYEGTTVTISLPWFENSNSVL
ncbi:sensor histidine kinase [Hathewaya proteolytica]|nr:HAMP domain-containing sensor histidine kinase [Hathewaya proteolytica]